jgi:IPT/TIG domain
MTTSPFQRVQPGDLITAAMVNGLFDQFDALELRVEELEAGTSSPPTPSIGAVVITSVTPQPVQSGNALTINGQNFGFSAGGNTVLFNGVPALDYRGVQSDTKLVVGVPDIPGPLPPSGGTVTLVVSNALTSATRGITVVPAPAQQEGNVDVLFDGADPDPITSGTTNDFQFHLFSRASLPAEVTVTADVGGQTWTAAILDEGKNASDGVFTLNHTGDTKTFYVRVTIPSATNGTPFSLTVDVAGDGISNSSGELDYSVGQFADPDTTFTLAPDAASGSVSGSTITASAGGAVTGTPVSISGDFTVAGLYDCSLALVPPAAAGWTINLASPGPPDHKLSVQDADLKGTGTPKHALETIQFRVKPASAATAAAQVRLTILREGETKQRTLTLDLHAAA